MGEDLMAATLERNNAGRFDTETVETALWAIALHAGSPTQASKALAAQGIRIPKQTLDEWKKNKHALRYAEVCNEASDRIAEKVAADAEQFMVRAAEVERDALDALHRQIKSGDIKDMGAALKNITTAKALNNDKIASPLRGRATIVTEDRNADRALERLARLGIRLSIGNTDNTAEPITDAEVVETPAQQQAVVAASS